MPRPWGWASGSADAGPPERADWLRPAQAGVALAGGARAAHIAATFVDLEIRGYVQIAETGDRDAPDWLLARRVGPASIWQRCRRGSAGSLLRYERALLRGLPRDQRPARLSELKKTNRWANAVRRAYRLLDREAIVRGWMAVSQSSPGPGAAQDRATDDGAGGTLGRLRAFRRYLDGLQPPEADAWALFGEYLPFAVAFGLTPEWAARFAALEPSAGAASRPGAGLSPDGRDLSSLGTAFAAAACAHVHSVVGHGSYGGSAGHHGGGFSHGGHGGGGHGGGHYG